MSTFFAEFLGTALLVLLGNGVVAGVVLRGTKNHDSGWIVITFGWALAVTMAIFAVGNYSGAHLNPAVTLALAAIGDLAWIDVATYLSGQMLGAMLGSALVWLHYLPHWRITDDPAAKLAAFSTAPAIRDPKSNFISEFLGTFVLLFGLMALGGNQFGDGLKPLAVGGLIFSIGLSLGGTTVPTTAGI